MSWNNYRLIPIVLALVLLPLGLQAQPWGQQSRSDHMWMADSLNLSATQKEQLQKEQQSFMKQMIQGQADLRVARLDLNNLLKNGATDKEVTQQVQKVIQAQGTLLEARTNHLLQVRKIVGQKMFSQWMEHYNRGRGRHPMARGMSGWRQSRHQGHPMPKAPVH